jgi:hypothetical protein
MSVTEQVRPAVVQRAPAQRGGMRFGMDFLGWLAATGTAVVLTGLAITIATIVTVTSDDPGATLARATRDPQTAGTVAAAAVAVILFLAYYSGGYVAGRMARVDGARQGIGVWLWAIIAAAELAVLGALADGRFNLLEQLNDLPRISLPQGHISMSGVTATIIAAVLALIGAVCGGLAGSRAGRADLGAR